MPPPCRFSVLQSVPPTPESQGGWEGWWLLPWEALRQLEEGSLPVGVLSPGG